LLFKFSSCNYQSPIITGGWVLFLEASRHRSVCPRHTSDVLQVKTKTLYDGSSTAPLHYGG